MFLTLLQPSQRLVRWLTALATTVYTDPGYFKEALDTVQFERHLHAQWRVMPWHLRLSTHLIALLVQWTAVLRFARPFTHLSSKQRMQWLVRWTHSALPIFRLSIRLILTLVKPAYFQQFNVQQKIKYTRPASKRPPVQGPVSGKSSVQKAPRPGSKRHQVLIVGTGAGGAVLGAQLAPLRSDDTCPSGLRSFRTYCSACAAI